MQELLSKNEKLPLREQEFYQLRLDDYWDVLRRIFIVEQAHAEWSEIDRQMLWDEFESERFPALEKAQNCYQARKLALNQRGYIYSDIDLF